MNCCHASKSLKKQRKLLIVSSSRSCSITKVHHKTATFAGNALQFVGYISIIKLG